jgi:amino-acid N-acetyltransferase
MSSAITGPSTGATRRQVSMTMRRAPASVTLRQGVAADAPALHALITANLVEGHLLPRTIEEIAAHASRFLVAVQAGTNRRRPVARLVGCVELAPLGPEVAEVRSLVVDRAARSLGIGRQLVDELRSAAQSAGFERLCAFTHDAGYFVRKGFTIVPHTDVPEKIATDCRACPLFGRCGQHAVVLPLAARRSRGASGRFAAELR